MSGGQEAAAANNAAWDAADDVITAVDALALTQAHDAAFGWNGAILRDININLRKYGLAVSVVPKE